MNTTAKLNWKWLAVPAAIVSALGLWTALGFPTIAIGQDINKLTRGQSVIAIEVYNNKVRGLLRDRPLYNTPEQIALWKEAFDQAKRELIASEQQKIRAPK